MGIKIGSPTPEAAVDYWIRGAHGPRRMTLAEHRGKWLVLFFYPRDFTFICPTELVAFGELEADFKAEEAVVIGASTDSMVRERPAAAARELSGAGRYLPPAQQGIQCPTG